MKDHISHRALNLELLRIYCMSFIVLGHIEGYIHLSFIDGTGLAARIINAFMSALGSGSVDCFVLISGFFLVSAPGKIKRVLNIYIITTFYLVSISFILYLSGLASIVDVFKSFFPLAPTACNYWFVNKYLGLLILQPFLSRFAIGLQKSTYRLLIFILLLLNTTFAFGFPFGGLYGGGFSLMWFVCLFFVGGYLRRYCVPMKIKITGLLFTLTAAVLIYMSIIILEIPYMELGYNSLIVLVISVCLFLLFQSMPVTKNRFVTVVSPHVFGVYLIHTHFLLKTLIGTALIGFIPSGSFVKSLFLLMCLVVIFLVSVMIDKSRVTFFRLAGIDSGIQKLSDVIEKFYSKVNKS